MNERPNLHHVETAARPALRVTMLGIRGFPDVQGGAEKHAEKLSGALADLGCKVEAVVRSPYVAKEAPATWRGIKLSRLWAPRLTGVEAFVHTLLGVVRAGFTRPDILHIHAIGPALFTPLARALGLRVVVTHHLPNYDNEKWGPFGRWLLRRGEWAGMAFAHGRIAVAAGLAKEMTRRYRVPVDTIPNGIDPPAVVRSADILRAFGLAPNLYALTVARIDEQKRQLDLIAAYARMQQPQWKLALVGGADYSGTYARAVAEAARQTPGVVMLGHQTGAALAALYSNAGVFVLPSSHEGQPIAVLEAASFGLPAILSDIAAHRELALPHARYFAVGDIAGLVDHLQAAFTAPGAEKLDDVERARIMARHDWQTIARRTLAVYRDALSGAKSGKLGDGSPL
jgi:glycosyltransferase involved in cell wall biosynthesis